jgi:uncharacterized protein (DUF305 family)
MRRGWPWVAFAVLIVAVGFSAVWPGRPSHDAADSTFVAGMLPHHLAGIRLLDLATERTDDVRLRDLVFQMRTYHDAEIDELRRWTGQWRSSGSDHVHVLGMPTETDFARLGVLSGEAFDRAWLGVMITHHEGALEMTQEEIGAGRNRTAIHLASVIATVQRQQIAAMEELATSLG